MGMDKRFDCVVNPWTVFITLVVLIAFLLASVPAGAVTGFTKQATLQSSAPLTGCGPDIWLPVGVVSQDTVIAGVTCDESSGQQEGGSVLVFEEPAIGWAGTLFQNQILYPSDPAADGRFGFNVDIDGDTMVVGSQRSGDNILGSIYVFTRSSPAGSWQETARLNASDGKSSWAWNPKIAGDVVIAGDSGPGVFGTRPGALYVFVKPALGWSGDWPATAKLVPSTTSNTSIRFGDSADIAGSVIVVGARLDNPVATGGSTGRGYVFVEPASGWADTTETAILTPSVTNDGLLFLGGYRGVVTDGDTVVMRSFNNSSPGFGLYIFEKPASGWASTTETARKKVWGDIDLDADTLIVNRFRAAGDYTENILLFERPASGWTSTLTPSGSFPHESTGQRVDASLDGSTAVIGQYVYVSSIPTSPVLQVTKGDNIDPVVVNGALTYTISVQNNGPGDVTEVTATDTLPAGVIYNGSSPAGDCTVDSIVGDVTTVGCTMRDLPEGDLTSVQLNVTVPGITGQITNTVTVDATGILAPVIANENTEVVDAASDLEILLFTHDPEPVFAGSTLGYFVDVINNGLSDAPAVTITVGLPSDTTFINAVARNALGQTIVGACLEVRESVVCDMGTVEAGDTVEVDVNVTVPTTVGIVTNTANVVSGVIDPGPGPNTATDQATVILAGIVITDSVNAPGDFLLDFGMVDVGSSVAGSIALTNNRASNVSVSTPFLDPPFYVIAPESCSGPPVDPGVKCVITIQFEPAAGDVNGALAQGLDLDIGSNSASFLITGTAVLSQADLAVFLTRVNNDTPSQNIFLSEYRIIVRNDGPADAVGFNMQLYLPPQVLNPRMLPGDPIGDLLVPTGGGYVLQSPNVFAAGTSANIVFEVDRTGNLSEASVTVGATTPDPDDSNNTSRTDAADRGRGGIVGCYGYDDCSLSDPDGRMSITSIVLLGFFILGLFYWRRRRVS